MALDGLKHATKQDHVVRFIVNGKIDPAILPKAADYSSFFTLETRLYDNNIGVPGRMAMEIADCDTEFVAKHDDDMKLPVNGWDILLSCMKQEESIGEKIGGTVMGCQNIECGILVPDHANKILRVKRDCHKKASSGSTSWKLVDYTGTGTSIYKRSVMNECCFSVKQKLGAGDPDLMWRLTKAGYRQILCEHPSSEHFHVKCTSDKYEAARWNNERLIESAKQFYNDHGMVFEGMLRWSSM